MWESKVEQAMYRGGMSENKVKRASMYCELYLLVEFLV